MKKHPKDMTKEELVQLVGAMGWMALDLAQHLNYSDRSSKVVYERAIQMAYDLHSFPFDEDKEITESNADICFFGAEGLTKISSFLGAKKVKKRK